MEKIIEDSYKVQLPKELCENLGFEIGTRVDFSIDNNSIKIEAAELPFLPHVAMIKIINALLNEDFEFAVYDLNMRQYTNISLIDDNSSVVAETPKEWLNDKNFAFDSYLKWNKDFYVFPINIYNCKKYEDELVGFIALKVGKWLFSSAEEAISFVLGILSVI